MRLTTTDQEIISMLTSKIRCLSLQQLSVTFWSGHEPNARRRLKRLVAGKVLMEHRLITRSLANLREPLAAWSPKTNSPSFDNLSKQLKGRWRSVVARPTSLFVAHRYVARSMGSVLSGKLPHPLQASHELGLAEVYLQFVQCRPAEAASWVGEDAMQASMKKSQVPDAVILAADGKPKLAIELGGVYSAERLRDFPQALLEQGTSL